MRFRAAGLLVGVVIILAGCMPLGSSFSPAGCAVKANDPHPSSHQPGRVNAELNVRCRYPVARLWARTQIWSKRWWGWDRTGDKGAASKASTGYLSAYANVTCNGTYTYKHTGTGKSLEGTTTYSATVTSSQRRIAEFYSGECADV